MFARTKSFANIFIIHISFVLMSSLRDIVFFSKILQNNCDLVSNPSFCTLTCNEALYAVLLILHKMRTYIGLHMN